MQTTLLGLGVAIILALVAALVGPLLIDWGGYRSIFESEASRLVGVNVRVTGPIDARLLPTPRLVLNAIEIGDGEGDAGKIKARALGIEFALGPILRGEWRATELHLAGPQLNIATDASGRVQAPAISVTFNPDALTVEKLSIEDGRLIVTDAGGSPVMTLDRFWFNGEARSLLGPVKGEGAVTVGGELYPFRLTSGRYGDDGTMRLRLNIDPVNRPLSIEADGALTIGSEPTFDGTLKLAKPVGIAGIAGGRLTQPWRVSARLKAGAQSALMEQIEFLYGPEEQALKLTGVADFKFGSSPRFDGVLSGRQIDLDRVLVTEDGKRPPPAAAMRELIELGGGAFAPAFPVSIGIGVDQITLGGNAVQNLRGDISADAGGWNLDRFEFRAPGFTQVRLSGHLAVGAGGVAFTGPAEIDASDPKTLADWLEGRGDRTANATPASAKDVGPLSLRGDVTLGSEKIAIEKLKAEFDRKSVSGRLAYIFATGGQQAKLDAALNAPELDLDAALGFGKALLAGSKMERPRDMTIAVDVGRASVGGFVGRDASARLKVDADGLQIDKLAVADLGGAAFSASGRIDTSAPSPRGSIDVDLNAPDMAPVFALLSRFSPVTVEQLSAKAAAMAPARLHARLVIEGTAPAAIAKVSLEGSLGKIRIGLNAQGNADAQVLTRGELRLDGKLEADDGKMLMAMIGLDRVLTVQPGPGALTLTLNGPASGDLRVASRLIAKGLDMKANGTARPFAETLMASLRATITSANAAPLRGPSEDDRAALPVTFDGRVAVQAGELTVSEINANIAGTGVRGKMTASLAAPHRLGGDLEADNVDAASLVAAAIGMPSAAPRSGKSWVWSSEPFADGAFGAYAGSVALKVRRLELSRQIAVREFRSILRFGNREFTIDDMAGDIGGGKLTGAIVYSDSDTGLTAQAKLSLAGADAAHLLPAGARPPVSGKLDLFADVKGTGLSPVALIGSLQGSGRIAIVDAQFAGLDPRAFDTVTRAVDQGLVIDNYRIGNIVQKALDSGQLPVRRAEASFTVSAGQLRLGSAKVDSKEADLAITGHVDLADGTIDARLVLSGSDEGTSARPDIFMALRGPATEPQRSVDVTALTGWLTLRAVETQARRLKALEAAQPRPAPIVPQPAPQPAPLPPPQASGSIPAPASTIVVPESAPKPKMAPALPAPLEIRPVPTPGGAASSAGRPMSVGPQN